MFEKSKWIAFRQTTSMMPAPYLRKSFYAREGIRSAVLNVCGLGLGVYRINGKSVTSDVLVTPITKYDSRLIWNAFDVTPLIRSGENALLTQLGNGWYNTVSTTWDYEKAPWRDCPKLIACLDITYSDGSSESIVSDSSWKCADSPVLYDETRAGEIYDARLELPGADMPGFDDSAWQNAGIARAAGGSFSPMRHPPVRECACFMPVSAEKGIYDFGQNMSGYVILSTHGEAGASILLEYAEILGENGDIDQSDIITFCNGQLKHADRYILKGDKAEEWKPSFNYHGFRYVKATVSGNAVIDDLTACFVHTDMPVIGSFECGDQMLMRIHRASVMSTLSNWMGIPTDCPHREQNGWTGDANIACDQTLMNFDALSSYSKWLDDLADVQRPSGQLPGIAPTGGWGYNWGSGPAWDSAMIQIPYSIRQLTGNLDQTRKLWENMNRYMRYMESMSENGICCFGLGDWCPPKGANVCPTALTDTAFFHRNCLCMASLAEDLGDSAAVSRYTSLGEYVRSAFRARFLESGVPEGGSQTAYAAAIYNGLYDESEVPVAAAKLNTLVLENGCRFDCGILGMKFIYTALSDNGYAETAYRATVNPEAPSYAWWMDHGYTTFGEMWEPAQSRNHQMYTEVDNWLYRSVAGIRPAKPGFSEVLIAPRFISELKWVKASHGAISVAWDENVITVDTPVRGALRMDGAEYPLAAGHNEFARNNK